MPDDPEDVDVCETITVRTYRMGSGSRVAWACSCGARVLNLSSVADATLDAYAHLVAPMTGDLNATEEWVLNSVRASVDAPWANTKPGWADDVHLGSPTTLFRLVAKGLVDAEEFVGPRGGKRTRYRLVAP